MQIVGRMLRVDDLETLGVSTQTLAEEAIQAGRVDEAIALVDYFHQEMRTMHTIMRTWLTDITRYIIARGSGADDPGQIGDLSNTLFGHLAHLSIGRGRCESGAKRRFGRVKWSRPSTCSTTCAWSSRFPTTCWWPGCRIC